MNFIEPDSRSSLPSTGYDDIRDANYFAFFDKPTPENLAANHSGILTQQQQSALEQSVANHKSTVALVIGMLLCVAFFAFFIFWKADSEDGVLSFANLAISGGVVTVFLGVLAALLTGDWFVFFARDDLEGGVVESAVGKVEWNGKRYQMRTDSRRLHSLRHGVVPPPPGEYRFYYLPHTGLVVMAEEGRNESAGETSSALFQALASANNFSPEDLFKNQNGLLSRHQENRLIRIVALYGLALLGCVVLLVNMTSQFLRVLSTTSTVLVLVIAAVLLSRFGWDAIQIVADLWNGRVSSVGGPVVRQSSRTRYHRSYYYASGSYKFEVSEAAYNALIEGAHYRIWFAPRSKRLVSIEPI